MQKYKNWPLFDEMPEGWRLDQTAGSPLSGYEFATNGHSVFNGGKRALVRRSSGQALPCQPATETVCKAERPASDDKKPTQPKPVVDAHYARTVNELARQKFKFKLLADIRVDLVICEIEGWCKLEYINELRALLASLGWAPDCRIT